MVAWQVISETAKSSKLLLSYCKSFMFKKFKFGHIKEKIFNVHSGITYNKTMQNQLQNGNIKNTDKQTGLNRLCYGYWTRIYTYTYVNICFVYRVNIGIEITRYFFPINILYRTSKLFYIFIIFNITYFYKILFYSNLFLFFLALFLINLFPPRMEAPLRSQTCIQWSVWFTLSQSKAYLERSRDIWAIFLFLRANNIFKKIIRLISIQNK